MHFAPEFVKFIAPAGIVIALARIIRALYSAWWYHHITLGTLHDTAFAEQPLLRSRACEDGIVRIRGRVFHYRIHKSPKTPRFVTVTARIALRGPHEGREVFTAYFEDGFLVEWKLRNQFFPREYDREFHSIGILHLLEGVSMNLASALDERPAAYR